DELSVNASLEGYAAHSVSIGRREQALREIPQSITVLTRQRLDDQNIHSLEQAMQFTPGVTIQPAGAGVLYDFYARGFPIKNVSFDSVQALPGGGGFDSQPDTAILERMEVLRGADGLFTGSGQPGGTVNLVRKRPLKRQQIAASFALGS
ncbi:TonB-dependent receptor plug domain-containing protein, partial [Cephaloticoccus primus]|uniref:TonB-dependent receptor plug domain-containing protein n=1 Tax=Cephaloticoccus primus TaxID=1548207 RepID=UPI000B23521A